MSARAAQLKKHPPARRLATLLATARHLQTKTIDDTLELLDLFMVTKLFGKTRREADKRKVRHHPKLAKASARLASAGRGAVRGDRQSPLREVRAGRVTGVDVTGSK